MDEIIRLENLTKKFKKNTVLSDVDLSICRGQSVALIGHNGVGKSTLLKLIARLSSPTAGAVHYAGDLTVRYVPEHFPRTNLTMMQYLMFMGKIDEIPEAERTAKIKALLQDFFMETMAHTPLSHLSKGTLQKVAVIQAILTTPDVLLLDEPISGQDIDSQSVFIKKMQALLAQKVTIVMSCHEQYLINELADTVFRVTNQQLRQVGFADLQFLERFCLTFVNEQKIAKLPDLEVEAEQIGNTVKLYVDSDQTDAMIKIMMSHHWTLRGMQHEKSN